MSERQSLISKVLGSRGLKGISEIRTFFRTNEQPIFFIGATGFNLLGIDRWVRGFEYIVYYDSWDGTHPRVFTPASKPYVEFKSSEEINNYLLRDAEVQKHIEAKCKSKGVRPMVAMVFFDEELEPVVERVLAFFDRDPFGMDAGDHLRFAGQGGAPFLGQVFGSVVVRRQIPR